MTATYTDGGPYSLDKIILPKAHIHNGREFPVAYALNTHDQPYDQTKVESLLTQFSKDGVFSKLIEDHGAVVIRDSIADSNDEKADVVSEFVRILEENRGHVPFEQNGTLALRNKKGYNLYTANGAPGSRRLLQHNEYSRFKRYPITLVFTILDYTAKGGETPLVHGGELYSRVTKEIPGFAEKLSRVGLGFGKQTWPKETKEPLGVIWNHEVTFGRHIKPDDDLETQKAKVEALAKEYISDDFKWTENDDFTITSKHNPVKTYNNGEKYLFSSIAAFSDLGYDRIKYGNGDDFKTEDLQKYNEISNDLEYLHEWKSGDIVLVHNYQVSHGKRPYSKEGKRVTWVGMWDEKDHTKAKVFQDYLINEESVKFENTGAHTLTEQVATLKVSV